jgi:hypothetical protein
VSIPAQTKEQIFAVECERRLGAGYTGGVLVNELKKRMLKEKSGRSLNGV